MFKKFKQATVKDYISWLNGYLAQGELPKLNGL